MAKQSGLGSALYIDGYDLSNDIGAIDEIGGGNEPLTVTGIDKFGIERIGGHRDGRISYTAYFNPAADRAHDRLSALPTTDTIVTYALGSAIGGPSAAIVAKQIGYDPTRGDDGSLTFKVEAKANHYGVEWGEQLTAGVADLTGAAAGSSLDYGASIGTTNHGLQAYLQVVEFTGTDATIAIQSSTDNGAGDAFANVTGAVFTTVTGIVAERIQTGRTAAAERYVRVNVTGTFNTMSLHVMVAKNLTATAF